jgi:hypothetical protein
MNFFRQLLYSLGIHKEPSLLGVWERIGDDFAGCRLRIEFDGSNLTGRILKVPDQMAKYGWMKDDAKWMHIQQQAICRYQLQELYKVLPCGQQQARNRYYPSRLFIRSENDLVIIPPDASMGRKNQWRRVNDKSKDLSTPQKKDMDTPAYPPKPNP